MDLIEYVPGAAMAAVLAEEGGLVVTDPDRSLVKLTDASRKESFER